MLADKLVCLRNDKEKRLLNGGLWTVNRVITPPEALPDKASDFFTDGVIAPPIGRAIELEVISEDEEGASSKSVATAPHSPAARICETTGLTISISATR
jgi:hypothetical protein